MDIVLTAYVNGEFAVSMEAHPSRRSEVLDRGAALPWMSTAWRDDVSADVISTWLECALPENGKLASWSSYARVLARNSGAVGGSPKPETIMWAHVDHEYPGALQVTRNDELPPPAEPIAAYESVSEPEMRAKLVDALQLYGTLKGSPRRSAWDSGASLSGVRPKISLTAKNGDPDLGWLDGGPGQANTWVIKVEDSRRNKGEAGIESICQSTLDRCGIPAALTRSRVVADFQCVLSERTDRIVRDGVVGRAHQEEFRQACDYGPIKHWLGVPNEPGHPHLHAILSDGGRTAVPLTRFLAASWLLGHGDLHRGNFGLTLSSPGAGPKSVGLAPAYDVSSAVGTEYHMGFVLPVGGQHDFDAIGAAEWQKHARDCGEDEDVLLGHVSDIVDRMPDAFSQARRLAGEIDENYDQGAVDKRADAMARRMASLAKTFAIEARRERR